MSKKRQIVFKIIALVPGCQRPVLHIVRGGSEEVVQSKVGTFEFDNLGYELLLTVQYAFSYKISRPEQNFIPGNVLVCGAPFLFR
jgi:hypothetical protein